VLAPQWLTGRSVTDFRVSRDGSRALVISQQNGKTAVQLTGISRDSGGVPKDLTQPLTLNAAVAATRGVWVNEATVAVMQPNAADNVVAELLFLKGDSQQMAPLAGMVNISGGNGPQDIFASTSAAVYQRVGNGWAEQMAGLVDPAYPG
jgi:hypothetical protein